MSDHHHHHRRQNEFSPDASRMSVQPEDVELKVGRPYYPFCHLLFSVRLCMQMIFPFANAHAGA